jgi:tetratricopeptide (TPR) repeat protein
MYSRFLFFIFLLNFVYVNAQQNQRLRDSILKYQFINPNLAVEFGMEYIRLREGTTPDREMVKTYSKIGEILLYMELYSSALEYFNSAIQISNSIKEFGVGDDLYSNNKLPWAILNIGNIYFKNGNYEKAMENFEESKELFDIGYDPIYKVMGLFTSNSNIGLVYGAMGEYDKQEKIYNKVFDYIVSNPVQHKNYNSNVLYSMSLLLTVKLHKGDLISAENKLNEINEFFESKKNEEEHLSKSLLMRNFGYAYSIMGAYYQSKKEYKKAINNLLKANELFKSFPVEINLTGSRLAECYLAINQINTAKEIALKNLSFKNLSDKEKRYNYKVLEKIYKKTKNKDLLLNVKDSLIVISTGANTRKVFKTLNDLETQILLSDSARALNESRIRYNSYLYILIIASVILFFSLVTIRINYNYQREKGDRLEIEKQIISSKLEEKNRELMSKTNFIIQRNDYLKKIQKKVDSRKIDSKISINRLSKELDILIRSEKSYSDFDKMFIEVYPDFYNKLNALATLSQTDLRLASYIKMNHSINEIASISGISLRTVESQRYRLSKKLNLEKDQNLNSFLLSI